MSVTFDMETLQREPTSEDVATIQRRELVRAGARMALRALGPVLPVCAGDPAGLGSAVRLLEEVGGVAS